MANAIDGIGTINVNQLVTQLMSVETGQQDKLKTAQSTQTGVLSAYKLLNTNFKSVLTASESIIGSVLAPKPWTSFSVTSSATSVAGSATSSAIAGTYSFDVNRLASAQKDLYAGVVPDLGTTVVATGPVTLTVGTGTPVSLKDAGNMTLNDLVSAINTSSTGVKASAIQVQGGYRLQVIGTKTGAANAFTLTGTTAAVDVATHLQTAQDAEIQFGPGVADVATSSTNTFNNVFPGVTFTVSKVEKGGTTGTGVTLTVGDNSSGMSKQVQDLVDAMNTALNTMKSQTSYDSGTKKGGPLLGDALPSRLSDSLLGAVMNATDGTTLKSVGIELNKDGTLKFDSSTFATYLQSDPDKAKQLVTDFAGRVATAAKKATDFGTGTITTAITSRQSQIDDISKQIAKWDDRLAAMKARYEKQFSALNTTLSKMSDQAGWLTGQLNSLSSSSSS